MNTITLNSTEIIFDRFSRNTDIADGHPNVYIVLSCDNNSQYSDLVNVGVINSIVVEVNGTTVYSMNNITAYVTNINESIMYDGTVRMDATIHIE